MFYRPHFSNASDLTNASPTVLPFGVVHGLHHLDRFKNHEHLEELTGRDFETAVAFMDVTAALYKHTMREQLSYKIGEGIAYTHITDTDLHDLISEYPDKADEMIAIIRERQTGDAALIRTYVENGTALREGML
jgi:hypothetical protein